VTWHSGNAAYVSDTGAVTQPAYGAGHVDVTVTATIKNGSATLTKRFTVTVVSREAPTPAEALALDLTGLAVGYYGSDSESSVTTHVILPTLGGWGSMVSWESSDESIIAPDGMVTRPSDTDTEVILTATLVNGTESSSKVFTLTVIATDGTDILRQILDDPNDLEIVYAGSDNSGYVSEDLTLRTLGANGCAIEWESSNESVVSDDGEVMRPNTDTEVTLTASIQKYSEEIDYWVCRTKTFTVTVAKNGSMSVESDLDDVEIVYADGDSADSVTSSVYLAKAGATGCRITWTSSNTDYITAAGKVTRPGPDGSDHVVTLTAAITNTQTGQTATRVFTLTVKKMTDEDAVREAAKSLSVYDAFAFDSATDIWESVTSGFLILTQGSYDTTISCSSGNTGVIQIGGVDAATGRLTATITRPADKDDSVILTATITRGAAVTPRPSC
jgi:hypothetical protein